MPHRVLGSFLPRKTLVIFVCAIAFALLLAPASLAQRGAHPAGGGQAGGGQAGAGRAAAPRSVPPAPIAAPQNPAPMPRMHTGPAGPHAPTGPGVQVA